MEDNYLDIAQGAATLGYPTVGVANYATVGGTVTTGIGQYNDPYAEQAQAQARAYELDRYITKREQGFAGYHCGTLQHYFECSHAEACNCGKVVLKTSKVAGCL